MSHAALLPNNPYSRTTAVEGRRPEIVSCCSTPEQPLLPNRVVPSRRKVRVSSRVGRNSSSRVSSRRKSRVSSHSAQPAPEQVVEGRRPEIVSCCSTPEQPLLPNRTLRAADGREVGREAPDLDFLPAPKALVKKSSLKYHVFIKPAILLNKWF
ncbi:hypothetical protein DdX_04058 [Ditylenchus destructor]|uniref:Uncharacterized protein n=1 Tax=Ditylenchus destructor TaxID=166010 RepID=A0AAD4RBP6_9BILA|nr:hypothetical protein DdX_04058 [Ditylenchus destructor]